MIHKKWFLYSVFISFFCFHVWFALPEMVFAVLVKRIWLGQDLFQSIADVLAARLRRYIGWLDDILEFGLTEAYYEHLETD